MTDNVDIDGVVVHYEDVVGRTLDADPHKPFYLAYLSDILRERFERFGNVTDINRTVSFYEDALRLLSDNNPARGGFLVNLSSAILARFEHFGAAADIDNAISAIEDAVRLTPDNHPGKSMALFQQGNLFHTRFQYFKNVVDIDKAISSHEDAAQLTPDEHPDKPGYLSTCGNSYLTRFQHLGKVNDIEENISAHEGAIRLIPDSHPHKPLYLSNKGTAMHTRFMRLGDIVDLQMAISAEEAAIQLTSDNDPERPSWLSNLAFMLYSRFKHLGDVADINRAISTIQNAVQLTQDDQPEKRMYLLTEGNLCHARFKHLGDVADLNSVISAHENGARLTPDSQLDKPGYLTKPAHLTEQGNALFTRFERLGDIADIDRSISVHEIAIRLIPDSHSDKPKSLGYQGNAFRARFQCLGDITDLHRAISAYKSALQAIPDGGTDKPGLLSNLGTSILTRFEYLGDIADLHKAISLHENAVKLTTEATRPLCLHNLCIALRQRFAHLGVIADIDRAILAHEKAIQLIPDDHPDKPRYWFNWGESLLDRFHRLEEVTDLNKVISAHEYGIQLIPEGHPEKPLYLTCQGRALETRFDHLGEVADLNRAISIHEKVIQLTPDGHADKPRRLSQQGIALHARSKHFGDVADIDKAISAYEDAKKLTPDGHPDRPTYLYNQGNALRTRFEHLGDIADIDRAISVHENALQNTPDDHLGKPSRLSTLGDSFQTRFDHFRDNADLDKAIVQFSLAACSSAGPPITRFNASWKWAMCAQKRGVSSLKAYSVALDLLPRVAWLGLTVADRHKQLAKTGDVVRDAAAAAIKQDEYGKALEWLEQGRSIVWGQLLNLRNPVDRLREVDPALADHLEQVSKQLEKATSRNISIEPTRQLSMEETSQEHRRLALDWDNLVERARELPGFGDFLLPKKLTQLQKAAQDGPVVIINVHTLCCDALVVMADLDDVIHIPLDNFSYVKAQQLQSSLDTILTSSGLRARSDRHMVRGGTQKAPDEKFRNILSELWQHVVKPVLDCLSFPISRSDNPPRIWWCPTGPLTFLPLHAAGTYQNNEPGSQVWDFVTSSYTPTLTALLETSHITTLDDEFKLLAIAQPTAQGHSPIPNTTEELIWIRKQAANLQVESLEGAEATVERVMQGMKESTWIHLACHGTQDADNPTTSALILHDGRLELSQVVQTPLPRANFAFLSACQTATGDKRLSDEAVHLAAGMLLVGYRGVIATTWSIKDDDAPFIANEVYSYLFKDQRPDRTKAAHALHHAVQKLRRDKGVPFLSWVPFIHVGM